MSTAIRNQTGRYDLGFDRMCKCGHMLGEHGNPDVPAKQRCCVADEGCSCHGFRKVNVLASRKARTEARDPARILSDAFGYWWQS